MIGSEIAHYRITGKLGEGGMGEVYRAEDSKLGREVAIKVLPEAVAEDPERLARFEREAQLLAALNHPGIAQIYGLETSGASRALAMELVPGPTLAEKLERGAPPLEETLAIARQIAEALEYAHEKGIVHRDLKPANVKLTPEGKVKVLDFGLAKAMEPATGSSGSIELAHSPTLTMGATIQGVILGTAGYMAPEQAKALPVDKRGDIWAFGVILHEMLTGRTLFAGDTVGDTLAAVIRADIDLGALPESTPPALRRLVRRCLERKPANRLRDIGDARLVLDELLAGGVEEVPASRAAAAAATPRRGAWLPWALAALAVAVAVWALLRPDGARSSPGLLAADLALTSDQRYFFQGDWGSPVVLAPDGESIVFGAQSTQGSTPSILWVRSLATGAEHAIEGTSGGYSPFFSPNSRSIGFFAEGKLKIVPVDGGAALTLADARNGRGGAWAPDGTIVYSPVYRAGLFTISARGGEPRPLTEVDASKHSSHRWPTLTADGKGVVFLAVHHSPEFEKEAGLRYVRLDGSGERAVVPARANGAIVGDRLLYLRETTLFAQRFDGAKGELDGEAAPVARNVLVDSTTWRATFSATPRRLVYATGSASGGSRLSWLDRTGRPLAEVAKTGLRGDLRLSPDGERVVESRGVRREDLWMIDLERGAESRFTFEDTSEWAPVWSPDGRYVYYVSTNHPDLRDRIFRKRADGTGAAELVYESTPELDLQPNDISPDGRVLALVVGTGPFDADADIAILPLDGSGPPRRLFETPYQEVGPRFSHDGRVLVFSTQESGISQVVVVALDRSGEEPRVTAKWQVSLEGGGQSAWSAKDDELVFLDPNNNLMSVAVSRVGDGSLRFGTPTVLFSTSAIAIRRSFDLAPDGRLLVNHFGEEQSEPLKLVEGWSKPLSD